MIEILVPDFARFGPAGLETLYCKICGIVIGEMRARPVGRSIAPDGTIIEKHVERFARNSEYCEMKIAYDDGSFHITNGCKACLQGKALDEYDLQKLTEADEVDLGLAHRNGFPIGIMQIKPGGGIV